MAETYPGIDAWDHELDRSGNLFIRDGAERATINGMNERDYAIMVQAMQTITGEVRGYWILSRIIGN